MSRPQQREVARFTLVAGLGLILDLGCAAALATLAGLPLPAAAAGGFILGATVNYAAHELWTFPGAAGTLSFRRWAGYLLGVVAVLAVRLAALAGLLALVPDGQGTRLGLLLPAVALSFAANFLLARSVIGRPALASARPHSLDLSEPT